MEAAIKRSKLFAPYADLIWLETKEPNLEQAKGFARRIREEHPGKYVPHPAKITHLTLLCRWLVYNLSPSFNWSAHGFNGLYCSMPRDNR